MKQDASIKIEEKFYIDIDKIIKNQKSKLVRKLPKFIVKRIKKIVRQDEINRQLDLLRHLNDIEFVKGHAEYLNIKVKSHCNERLPDDGRYIFVCNHPLGAIDFYAALMVTREKYPVVKALANDVLLHLENLQTLFLPVNAFGKTPAEYHKKINEAFSSEVQVMTFPAGEVSRKRKGQIKDGHWHRSFVRNAVDFKRDIIPIYIHAQNSKRFYRLGTFRKRLGIKLNLELFLLPDEMFRQRDKTIDVVIGNIIPYKKLDDSKTHLEWAQEIREIVYSMKTEISKPAH